MGNNSLLRIELENIIWNLVPKGVDFLLSYSKSNKEPCGTLKIHSEQSTSRQINKLLRINHLLASLSVSNASAWSLSELVRLLSELN